MVQEREKRAEPYRRLRGSSHGRLHRVYRPKRDLWQIYISLRYTTAEIISSTLRADAQCVVTQMVLTSLPRIWREAG